MDSVDVTSAVEPSEGFQTSTAVREHHGVSGTGGVSNAVAGAVVVSGECADVQADPDVRQEKAVVLREPARFAALKTRSLWRQLASAEAIGLTLFFTANVLILQLYLGALRSHADVAKAASMDADAAPYWRTMVLVELTYHRCLQSSSPPRTIKNTPNLGN